MDLASVPLWSIFVASLVLVLGSAEIGRMVGLRGGARSNDDLSTLEASLLGLLALIIGFTFAMALSKADSRREAVIIEVNAIGTTALRARLLPAPHNTDTLKLLREYVQIRLSVTKQPTAGEVVSAAIARSNAIQEALWQQVKAVSAKVDAMVPTGLFIQALNEMIDSQASRLAATYNHVPTVVLLTLYGIAMVASAFSGYARGVQGPSVRIPLYVVSTIVCIVILQIQDLDRTARGLITISQKPFVDLAASLATYQE
jgi:hypothetical protein